MCAHPQYLSPWGQFYLPNQPERLMLSVPEAGTRFEIVDLPFAEYDQTRFVCRETAELLTARYPDLWEVQIL